MLILSATTLRPFCDHLTEEGGSSGGETALVWCGMGTPCKDSGAWNGTASGDVGRCYKAMSGALEEARYRRPNMFYNE